MSANITVSRDYLLSLFRRLELNGVQLNDQSIPNVQYVEQDKNRTESTIMISVNEYKELKTAAQEYQTLTNALVAAGTPLESIKVLAKSIPSPTTRKGKHSTSDNVRSNKNSLPFSLYSDGSNNDNRKSNNRHEKSYLRSPAQSYPLPTPSPSSEEMTCGEDAYDLGASQEESSNFCDNNNDRSLILKGLPKSASLADVTNIIRGGKILNVFMRPQHGTAHVAFVEPSAAERFLIYAKNNEVVIKGKPITVSWDDNQYYMLGMVARRIYQDGATRNLVIRFPSSEVTQKVIRDDLEHIHMLEIVDLHFRNGHAWISLNSIKHTITAKSCMSSRLRYKGSRIEFWPDECAAPPTRRQLQSTQPRKFTKTLRPTAKVFSNPFSMLNDENRASDSDVDSEV